jgi:hypothetical protein
MFVLILYASLNMIPLQINFYTKINDVAVKAKYWVLER